ncbi:hypothetical protein OG985_50345 (plasmid) [Streptomyces sp. NBC_00289]|uniref:hypothetical protein n=1 Tax=Streptomyces sp. NBC_00289 TaxID=2975703 RepID=UPI002F91AFA3
MNHNEIQHFEPQPLPVIPPGMTVAYTVQGQPVYVPQQQAQPQPVIVQMPSQPIPTWLRNGLIASVGLLILCTPAAVLLVVAAPAIAATGVAVAGAGQAIAYSGIGVGIGVIGVAAAIKSLRETPRAAKKK